MLSFAGIFEGHWDPTASIVQDGQITAHAEEERFVRLKHAPRMYPINALKDCLNGTGLKPGDISAIAVNWDTDSYTNGSMKAFFEQLNQQWHVDSNTIRWQQYVLNNFNSENVRRHHEDQWRRAFGDIQVPPIYPLPHHYVHCLHAFLQSPFNKALCITVDGSGDRHCTVLWDCNGTSMRAIREICMPHSLGWFYAAFTEYLGFKAYNGEYKVMGLAAYGQPDGQLRKKVSKVLSVARDGIEYRLNPRFIHYGKRTWSDRFTDDLVELFGRPMRLPDEPITAWHKNLAYTVQDALEESMCRLAMWGIDQLGVGDICVGGGVGLNVKMNSRLFSITGVRSFFAQPLCSDGGAAAGAALGACWKLTGCRPKPLTTLALGHQESDASIRKTLERCRIPYERVEQITEAVADELAAGRIVGWFQGPMEGGPRALGQRSILADPREATTRDHLNTTIKFREDWRPFCPSIPAEDAGKFLKRHTHGSFMNIAFEATDAFAKCAPAVVHVDGTVRVQLVDKVVLPQFHQLLRAFEHRTGVPALLNTSFNVKGEPIVCTFRDALRTFYSTGLEVLAAGPFLVRKTRGRQSDVRLETSNAGSCPAS